MHRPAVTEFSCGDKREKPAMTWGTPIINDSPLPRPDLWAWTRALRTEVTISIMESYDEMHEVRWVSEYGSRVAWKTLVRYVDGRFIVQVQLGTYRASFSNPSKALFV